MIDLISTIYAESEAEFQVRLMSANGESRAELLEMREGIAKRAEYMNRHASNILLFDTAEEKLRKIKEWYPRTYRILQTQLPGFIMNPNDMPPVISKMADGFALHTMLPADHRLLGFA